ncbi:hypothetical protein QVZ43_09660 [Marinobacter sp. chi1]|uniref:DUF4136 domain-containing protein n=1 Tax=Marinobacter suaedae TaxID=3057675 RepID=A0ABT8W187_9GAMM|nr:hypothetical protein [Marinobacter sp. chi1]MDO3721989.1 hypothetical protein [Marinobacter sp. chi1]
MGTSLRLACLLLPLLMIGCGGSSGTRVDRIEAAPTVSKSYEKVLVFVVSAKQTVRDVVERQIVAEMNESEFESGRFGMANADVPWEDAEQLQTLVAKSAVAGQYDGVLVVSLMSKDREARYVPEQVVYQPITTSVGPLASTTYMDTTVVPQTYQESTSYVLKSTLFDTESTNPVWQMYSTTVDPESLDKAAKEFGEAVVSALRKTLPRPAEE